MSWKEQFPKSRYYETDNGILYNGNCIEHLKQMADNTIDIVITDPPYGLSNHPERTIRKVLSEWLNGNESYIPNNKGFMNKEWDAFVPSPAIWQEVYRVMKPGGTILVFAGTRTYDLMAISLRLAGFEIKDTLMWLYGCISEDTEILTTQGWKNYKNISKQDIVFSFDTKKHRIVKSKINQVFIYPYEGEMINLKNHNTDQLITPNHKVISKMGYRKQKYGKRSWYKEDEWVYRDAWQMRSNQYTLPLASVYDGEWSIGGDFAEVIGWVLSEGNYQKDCNAVNIYQSSVNPDKVARIRYCLNKAGIKYSEYQRKRKYKGREYIEYHWYINGESAKRIKEIIPNKKPTWKLLELKYSEKERLIKGLVAGDGSKNRSGKYGAFYQKDIKFLEWFQILLHLTGKQGWINYKKHSCSIHYNDSTQIQAKHNKNRIVDYKGIVWSINTDIGNYIARRKGKIFITGNSGFPKATDISKQIDKKFGAKREIIGKSNRHGGGIKGAGTSYELPPDIPYITEPATPEAKLWQGYKSHGLKPAYEPIIMAMKPNEGSYADNALKWKVAGLNIDAGRIETSEIISAEYGQPSGSGCYNWNKEKKKIEKIGLVNTQGRFPANILLDEESAKMLDEQSGARVSGSGIKGKMGGIFGSNKENPFREKSLYFDKGGASRFFYVAKASKKERGENNNHPTVKPLKLMKYLVKLTSMPSKDQIYLDPFLGSGTTAMACEKLNKNWIGIEINEGYCKIARERLQKLQIQRRLI